VKYINKSIALDQSVTRKAPKEQEEVRFYAQNIYNQIIFPNLIFKLIII
jgi:hypothetical protein